jgi:hypothetical protein
VRTRAGHALRSYTDLVEQRHDFLTSATGRQNPPRSLRAVDLSLAGLRRQCQDGAIGFDLKAVDFDDHFPSERESVS